MAIDRPYIFILNLFFMYWNVPNEKRDVYWNGLFHAGDVY